MCEYIKQVPWFMPRNIWIISTQEIFFCLAASTRMARKMSRVSNALKTVKSWGRRWTMCQYSRSYKEDIHALRSELANFTKITWHHIDRLKWFMRNLRLSIQTSSVVHSATHKASCMPRRKWGFLLVGYAWRPSSERRPHWQHGAHSGGSKKVLLLLRLDAR